MFKTIKNLTQGSTKNFSYFLITIILTLGLSISAQSLLAAWSTPTANPPTGNISPPLDQSINAQVKAGPLGITGDFYVGASNALYVDSANNRLGIGISSPAHNLHIYQDSGNNAELDIQSVAGANNHWAIYNNRADNALRFWQTDNRLTILPNGNVGIGITSPNAKLTVKTTTAFNQFSLVNSAYYTGGWARGADMQFRKSDSSLHRGLAYGIYGGGGTLNGAYFSAIEDDASPWNTAQLFLRSNGNVGIGTNNPGEKLDVKDGFIYNTKTDATIARIGLKNSIIEWAISAYGNDFAPNGGLVISDETVPRAVMIFNTNGNVGIGTNNPGEKLDVNGNVRADAFYYSSDQKLKTDIKPIIDALDKVKALQGVEFKWRENNKEDIGLLAQDVEKILPQVVHTNPQTGLKSVEYGNLVAVLIEAIKEQQKQIDQLRFLLLDNNK